MVAEFGQITTCLLRARHRCINVYKSAAFRVDVLSRDICASSPSLHSATLSKLPRRLCATGVEKNTKRGKLGSYKTLAYKMHSLPKVRLFLQFFFFFEVSFSISSRSKHCNLDYEREVSGVRTLEKTCEIVGERWNFPFE